MNRAEASVVPVLRQRTSSLRDLFQLLRPMQWSKNTVLFAALIFA